MESWLEAVLGAVALLGLAMGALFVMGAALTVVGHLADKIFTNLGRHGSLWAPRGRRSKRR